MTPMQRYEARKRFNRLASNSVQSIVEGLAIDKRITLGKARHTLTNILKKHKVDREFVKDILGHTSIVTADNYYDQFEDDQHSAIFNSIVSVQKMKERITTANQLESSK